MVAILADPGFMFSLIWQILPSRRNMPLLDVVDQHERWDLKERKARVVAIYTLVSPVSGPYRSYNIGTSTGVVL